MGRWTVRTQNFQTKNGEVLGFSERYPIFFEWVTQRKRISFPRETPWIHQDIAELHSSTKVFDNNDTRCSSFTFRSPLSFLFESPDWKTGWKALRACYSSTPMKLNLKIHWNGRKIVIDMRYMIWPTSHTTRYFQVRNSIDFVPRPCEVSDLRLGSEWCRG